MTSNRKVVGYARANGCLARKLDFGQGWPDVMFLYRGQILFAEFKGDRGVVEPLQFHVHGLLEKQGFVVVVIKTAADGMHMIDLLTAGAMDRYTVRTMKKTKKTSSREDDMHLLGCMIESAFGIDLDDPTGPTYLLVVMEGDRVYHVANRADPKDVPTVLRKMADVLAEDKVVKQ